MRPSIRLLAVLVLLAAGPPAGALVEGALVLRATTLHAEADANSARVAELAPSTRVDVHGRQGLWLLVSTAAADPATRGWLRLTHVRMTGEHHDAGAAQNGIGGGLARFSRSVTSLFGGLRGRETRTAHATIGIRGLTPGELTTATFDGAALDRVAAAAASAAEAEQFARAGGLVARNVPDVDEVAP